MVSLPYPLGWFLICIFNGEEFIYGTFELRIELVFAILTTAPLISEYLLGNTPVNANSPKVSGYLSLFLYLVLIFVVSHVNLLHIHVSTYPKNDY